MKSRITHKNAPKTREKIGDDVYTILGGKSRINDFKAYKCEVCKKPCQTIYFVKDKWVCERCYES